MVKPAASARRGFSNVLAITMRDHIVETFQDDIVYSLPRSAQPVIQPLTDFFNQTAEGKGPSEADTVPDRSKRQRTEEGSRAADASEGEEDEAEDLFAGLDEDYRDELEPTGGDCLQVVVPSERPAPEVPAPGPEAPYPLWEPFEDHVFFKISLPGYGLKKVMKVAPGAGAKLDRADMAIILHQLDPRSAAQGRVVAEAPAREGVCVLRDLGDPHVLEDRPGFTAWSPKGGLMYKLTGVPEDMLCLEENQACATWLVRRCAFPERQQELWPEVPDGLVESMLVLEACGVVSLLRPCADTVQAALTHGSLARLMNTTTLTRPQSALFPREGLALEDRTSWELILELRSAEWEWAPWVAPTRRGRRSKVAVPLGYAPGDRKVFFSSPTNKQPPCREYLMCLVSAEDVVPICTLRI